MLSKKGFALYALLLIALSTFAVALVSAWLALKGHLLPWITPLPGGGGYAIRNGWILLPGIISGFMIAGIAHRVAQRTQNRMVYWGGPIFVILVVTVTALVLYGGACGFCAKVVCPGQVQACGVKLQLSITFFKIYCSCYNPNGWLPQWPNLIEILAMGKILPAMW